MASAAATAAATPLAAAPAAPNYQVVDKPNPRQTLYGRDLYNGTPESVQAYKEQVRRRAHTGSAATVSLSGRRCQQHAEGQIVVVQVRSMMTHVMHELCL